MRIRIEMIGKTPLMMHNERLADADDPYTKQIKEITDKKGDQTDTDKQMVSKLEWRGGLYLDSNDEVCIPSANVIRCLRDAATPIKKGKAVRSALSPIALNVPLQIDGPRHVDKLVGNPIYWDRRMVKVNGRVKRTRPIFPKWSLSIDFEMLEDTLNYSTLVSIVEMAGRGTGLAEARIIGYGRFESVVSKVK